MDLQLAGRTAIITGGSLGIGLASAKTLAKLGVRPALVARRKEPLDAAVKEIADETGVEALAVPADVTDTVAVRNAVATVMETFGRIDILLNGAAHPGGLVRNEVEHVDPEALLTDINIKVIGYVRFAQAVLPHMRANGFGRIINIGGLTGRGSKVVSGMRNLAICHFTKVLSDQAGPDGITVNVIHPGVVETPHIHELYEKEAAKQGLTPAEVEANYAKATPIRRILQPDDVSNTIAFLCSPLAGAITGESIGVDGGITRGIFL